ncbi:hypothetical protein MGH68_12705 [Erysipelothrix sp. D19-032]
MRRYTTQLRLQHHQRLLTPNGIELVNRSLEATHEKGFTDLYGAKSGYTEMVNAHFQV